MSTPGAHSGRPDTTFVMYHRTGAVAQRRSKGLRSQRFRVGGERREFPAHTFLFRQRGAFPRRAGRPLLAVRDDLVDEAVLFSLRRRHDAVALDIALDLLEGLPRVLGDDAGGQLAHADNLLGLNLDVAGLSADAARDGGLVDEDARVRQREALAFGPGRQKQRAHRSALTQADRHHLGADELHRVVDGHAGGDRAAGAVDVKVDVLLRVLRLQKEQLRDDEVRDRVVDRRAEEDDVVAQEARVDVRVALAARRLLEDRRVGNVLTHLWTPVLLTLKIEPEI